MPQGVGAVGEDWMGGIERCTRTSSKNRMGEQGESI